jgi:hypothetical protein
MGGIGGEDVKSFVLHAGSKGMESDVNVDDAGKRGVWRGRETEIGTVGTGEFERRLGEVPMR